MICYKYSSNDWIIACIDELSWTCWVWAQLAYLAKSLNRARTGPNMDNQGGLWFVIQMFTKVSLTNFFSLLFFSRVLSFFHATLVSVLGIYNVMFDKPTWDDTIWWVSVYLIENKLIQ